MACVFTSWAKPISLADIGVSAHPLVNGVISHNHPHASQAGLHKFKSGVVSCVIGGTQDSVADSMQVGLCRHRNTQHESYLMPPYRRTLSSSEDGIVISAGGGSM